MTSKQEAKLNMYNAVIAYCDESTGITETIPAFDTTLTAFKAEINAIETTAQLEAQIITGIAINKADLKKSLCNSAEGLAAALFAYATAEEDPVLQEKANYSFSDLFKLKDDELTFFVQNLHNDASAIVASLAPYGVTAATLSALEDLIEEYGDSVSAPRNAAALRKTYVAQLVTLFKECDTILKAQLDKLAVQFKTTQPEFYATYKNNRKIINSPTSATQAKGIIIDSVTGLPIYEVVVAVEEEEYNATSDLEGGYTVKIPQPGIYTLSFVKKGYQPYQSPNTEILLGQATVIDVQLTPAA
jgi:hypothetical protein